MPPKNEDVVSSLMRAAAGSSAKDVTDGDLDTYIAEMLTKEAQEKKKKYDEIGVEAYQLDARLKKKPKPNTRFLLNVVKATDSHNQAVIKANDENVARMRRERLDKERLERERNKLERSASPRHRSRSRSRSPRRRSNRSSSPRRRSRSPKRRSHKSSSKSSRSPSPKRHHHKSSKHRRRSSSPKRNHRHHHHSSSSKRHRHGSRSPSPTKKHSKQKQETVQFKGRGKVRINVSSMDKYFSEGYDPLFDTHSDEEKSDMVGPLPPP